MTLEETIAHHDLLRAGAPPALELQNIHKAYGAHAVLKGVHLTAHRRLGEAQIMGGQGDAHAAPYRDDSWQLF